MNKSKVLVISAVIILMIFSINLKSQIVEDSWAPILYNGELIYVDLKNIDSFQGDEIYVWTIERLAEPLRMEDIEDDIYTAKTYYLINKKLKRYSLLEIIYYDTDHNVIKDYTYKSTTDDPDLKYNYPIYDNSLVDLVLQRCLREIESNN